MKTLFAIISGLVLLVAVNAHAESSRYSCTNFPGERNASVTVDLATKSATFTRGQAVSDLLFMSLDQVGDVGTILRYQFDGADEDTQWGRVRVSFTPMTRTAHLFVVDSNEMQFDAGSVKCTRL